MISPSRARVAGGAPLGEGQVPENTALLGRSLTRGPGMPWARPVLSLLVVGLVIAGLSALLALAVALALALAPAAPAFADTGNGSGSGASASAGSSGGTAGSSTSSSGAGASAGSAGTSTGSTSHAHTGFVPCSKCLVIHFDSRGGSAEPDEIEDIDNPAQPPASPPSRAGYRFDGWYACTVAPDESLSNCTLWTWSTIITAQTPGIVSTQAGGFTHWEYTLFAQWTKTGPPTTGCTTPDCTTPPPKKNPGGGPGPLAHTGVALAACIIVSGGLLTLGLLLIVSKRKGAHQLQE